VDWLDDRSDNEMRVLVTGGRNYLDRDAVFRALDKLAKNHRYGTGNELITVIHGACCVKGEPTNLRGADRWAQEWAQEREYAYLGMPAQWGLHGDRAGPHRNAEMLTRFRPTNVVAFPGGSGTANMIHLATKSGLVVWEPDKEKPVTSPVRRPLRR